MNKKSPALTITYKSDGSCGCHGCGPDHKKGTPCLDYATMMYGAIDGVVRAVCVECLVELAKKLL